MGTGAANIPEFFWLVLIAFFVAIMTRRSRAPYSLWLVLTGLLIGVPHLLKEVRLQPDVLFTFFLPPLLFESAINIPVKALARDWKPITIYTLLGTLASTFIVGEASSWLLKIPIRQAMVFGALISPTDPISIIALFRRLGAGRRLTLIIEAESLFNDGIAAVLFSVMLAAAIGVSTAIPENAWLFVRLVAGGAILGVAVGFAASRVHAQIDDHLVEITLTTIVAFGSFLAADAVHVSGVVAVVAAGLVIGNFGMPTGMSPGTRVAVTSFWEYAAFVVNSVVFLLVGVEVSYVDWRQEWKVALVGMAAVLAGRCCIYPLSTLVNALGGQIPRAWQHILVWGGLRGALSMALALGLDKAFPHRSLLVVATFGVVLLSLMAQGLTLEPLLVRLKLLGAAEPDEPCKPDEPSRPAEVGRLGSQMLACLGALAELNRLQETASYPDWAIATLIRQYQNEMADLEAALERVQPDWQTAGPLQDTRLAALMAQKSAYQRAARGAWLSDSDRQKIVSEIDAAIVRLVAERDHTAR